VCDTEDKTVSAFSLQGVGKFKIGELDDPVGVAVDKQGNLYISERRTSKIKVFDTRNKLAAEIDLGGIEVSSKVQPGKIAVSRSGNLLVVDQANQQILVFDRDRKLKLKFGKIGDRQGEFRTIEDVAVDRQDRMYVVDSSGFPVQVFDKSGGYISRIGVRSEVNGLIDPVAITVDRFDQMWIVDSSAHNIRIYDRIGMPLQIFGEYGMTEKTFFYPVDVELDAVGGVYVLERGLRRMQSFALTDPFQPIPRSR
jgi:tripartite motif-containing protein 71